MNKTFFHQTVTTQEIENYLSEKSGLDLTAFFNQYLRDIKIPNLEYSIKNNELNYRWTNVVENFKMPIEIEIDDQTERIYPTEVWKTIKISSKKINIDRNYYINHKQLN